MPPDDIASIINSAAEVVLPAANDSGGAPPGDPPAAPDVFEACARFEQNDTGNGKRLLAHFGADILHVRDIGWHSWAGTHWALEGGQEAVEICAQKTAVLMAREAGYLAPSKADEEVMRQAQGLAGRGDALSDAEKELILAAKIAEEKLARRQDKRRGWSVSCGNRSRTVAMISQAMPHRTVAPDEMNREGRYFNVQNGTLWFRRRVARVRDDECPDPEIERFIDIVEVDVQMIAHDRDHMITHLAPVAYDPAAICAQFLAFLERFQPNARTRRFLQVAAARALLGGASTQVLIFLFGEGANGKSVFMETLTRLLGTYAGRLRPESITGAMEQSGDKASPDFARLAGARFVAIAELPRGAPLREGLIKTMTGGEPMPVRHLNKGFFDLVPQFIPFMSGNQMPEVSGLDRGIWRRLKFVPWTVSIPPTEQKPLPEVVAGFMAEAPGILNWMIEGARIFLTEGLIEPPDVLELGEEHRGDSDPVGQFVKACVEHRPGNKVQARTAYKAFEAWCAANSVRAWKEKSFSSAFKLKGFKREDGRVRYWLDITLAGVPDNPDHLPRNPYGSL